MQKISDKLLSWASVVDQKTIQQALTTSRLEFVKPHVALMPDAHFGMGSTVGSVIPTVGAILPASVGVDLGCGMIAVKTQFKKDELKDLPKLRHSIERSVPVSAGGYNRTITASAQTRIAELENKANKDYSGIDGKWKIQMGTLGSGNHFIEIVHDENDDVWAFLHSGSRGIGNKIAQKHIKIAQEHCKRNFIKLEDRDLAYLVEGTPEFDEYIEDMLWAQDFALLNREEMMDRVIKDLGHHMGTPVKEAERINCHHNFTEKEHHLGKNVWLTRKGAIKADKGRRALIPGSMGTASYVTEGKGNVASFNSCPHGAGRVFSRSAAKQKFTLEDLEKRMEGIEYRSSESFIDEIPDAYKPIDVVMEDSKDLCEVKHIFKQIVNVKGN